MKDENQYEKDVFELEDEFNAKRLAARDWQNPEGISWEEFYEQNEYFYGYKTKPKSGYSIIGTKRMPPELDNLGDFESEIEDLNPARQRELWDEYFEEKAAKLQELKDQGMDF